MRKDEIKICAIYGRVSDEEAAGRDHGSLEQQEHMGRDVADQLSRQTGIKHLVKYVLIEKKGITGATTQRPEYQKLLTLIRTKAIDVVIAKELSRVNRSVKDFSVFLDLCQENNVRLLFKGMDADPTTAAGKMLFNMLASFAQMERDMVSERVKASIRSRVINNHLDVGGFIPLGLDKHPTENGNRLPNKDELKQVVALMNQFLKMLDYTKTCQYAKRMGIKTKYGEEFRLDTLKSLLRDRRYIGEIGVPGEESFVKAPWGVVVPKELFQKVQEAIATISEKYSKQNRTASRINLLIGLLKGEDGVAFRSTSVKKKDGKKYYYYRNDPGKIYLDAEMLEDKIMKTIQARQDDKSILEKVKLYQQEQSNGLSAIDAEIAELKKTLQEVEAENKRLVMGLEGINSRNRAEMLNWLEGMIEQLNDRKADAEERIILLTKKKGKLESRTIDARSLKFSLRQVFERIESVDRELIRGFYRQMFDEITFCRDNTLKLVWKVPCIPYGKKLAVGEGWLPWTGLNRRPSD